MAVEPFVVSNRDNLPRKGTELPPARRWVPGRPGDLGVGQPEGGQFGYQGPDQGYALRLADLFHDRVALGRGESWHDAEYGVIAVACRRASIFGRAPIKDDLELGFLVWGFLPDGLPQDLVDRLVALRRPVFADVAHDAFDQRRISEAVPEDVLRSTPADVRRRMASGENLITL